MYNSFAQWRADRQLTQLGAALALGITMHMVKDLERGHRIDKRREVKPLAPSLTLRLAMAAITARLQPVPLATPSVD